MEKQLTKPELYEILPYLEKELEYKKETKGTGLKLGYVISAEWSKLESAVLITGKKKGFPDAHMDVDVQDKITYVYETQIELVDRKGNVRRLEKTWDRTFNITQKIFPIQDRGRQGEYTNKVLKKMWRKPKYVVVKKINTSETLDYSNIEIHRYKIKVYKMPKRKIRPQFWPFPI